VIKALAKAESTCLGNLTATLFKEALADLT